MKKVVVTLASVSLALAGCSSSITEPASPATSLTVEATQTAAPDTEPEPVSGRNPYETGADADWSIGVSAAPTAIGYDRQSGTVVVATEDGQGTRLEAFSVSSSGRTLPAWTYKIPDGGSLISMDAASGSVYLSIGEDPDAPEDLIILSARSGSETLRWSHAHLLDTDIPQLVGAYDSGGGIAKLGRDSLLAAIIEENGTVINDERLFLIEESAESLSVGVDIVNTHVVSQQGTAFISYPELKLVYGAECWSVSDGLVCLQARAGSAQAREAALVAYDRRGNVIRETDIGDTAAALNYELVSMNADVSASELANALAQPVSSPADSTSSEDSGDDSGTPIPEGTDPTTPAEPVPDGDEPVSNEPTQSSSDVPELLGDGVAEPMIPADRTPAILSNGVWVTQFSAEAKPLANGAPFGVVGATVINLETGAELSADPVLVGQGHSADMFFAWDGQRLTYLRPRG